MPTQNIFNLVDTWASGGGPYTSIKMNATDNDAGSASLLMDLQVGGSSKFKVGKDGTVSLVQGSVAGNTNTGGQVNITSAGTIGLVTSNIYFGGASFNSGGTWANTSSSGFVVTPAAFYGFASANNLIFGGGADTFLTRRAAANLRLGAADAAAPVAQTLSVQSVVAGTTNTAGANLTITGSQGTGTGAGGSIVFQVAPAGLSGPNQNALADALTINSARSVIAPVQVIAGTTSNAGQTAGVVANGIYLSGGMIYGPSTQFIIDGAGIRQNSGNYVGWGDGATSVGTVDVFLRRDAANTLALRNGANNQELRVYGSYTSASVYDRLTLKSSSTVATIAAETDAGDMDLALTPAGSGNVQFGTHAAVGAETITGYITIKDAGGTLRKLAVIS